MVQKNVPQPVEEEQGEPITETFGPDTKETRDAVARLLKGEGDGQLPPPLLTESETAPHEGEAGEEMGEPPPAPILAGSPPPVPPAAGSPTLTTQPTPQPSQEDALRREVEVLREREAKLVMDQALAQATTYFNQQEQAYTEQLVRAGHDEETARATAKREADAVRREWDTYLRNHQQQQVTKTRAKAARETVKKYGLTIDDLEVLEGMASEAQMVQYAQDKKEKTELKAKVAALEKSRVQPQQFAGSRGGGRSATREQMLDLYNAGDRRPAVVAAAREHLGL